MTMTNKIENINPNTLFIGKKIIYLPNCHSTNDSAQLILGNNDVFEGTTIVTNRQTSGKGQKGNHWQSEPGKNLTFSIILKPGFLDVKQQFKLNFAVSLGIFDFLSSFLKSHVKIKWPNDIYYKDSKIAGILIENSIRSMKMQHSIVGIGINVNQVNFEKVGYAVSMKTISGKEYSLENMLADLLGFFEVRYLQLKSNKHKILKSDYMQCLYWYEEKRLFRIPDSGFRFSDYKFEKNQIVEGKIIGIDESGKLGIKIGKEAIYFGFKEIEFVK
ncbi:MAG: biotin--[acetyl-CoA-carboxylase] ligase [Cytophagales bacterium]|nr:biotin--[acetyl-CoA-carboxylase] ligase [Cytophagales bacterium]